MPSIPSLQQLRTLYPLSFISSFLERLNRSLVTMFHGSPLVLDFALILKQSLWPEGWHMVTGVARTQRSHGCVGPHVKYMGVGAGPQIKIKTFLDEGRLATEKELYFKKNRSRQFSEQVRDRNAYRQVSSFIFHT